jgi:hypothetical protein
VSLAVASVSTAFGIHPNAAIKKPTGFLALRISDLLVRLSAL